MPDAIQIRCLQTIGDREIQGLSDVLIDCVEGGASVSFMLPMTRAKAEAFWRGVAASVARGERVVLAAEDADGSDRRHGAGHSGAAREPAASRRPREDARASTRAPARRRRGAARRRRAQRARRRQDAAGARHGVSDDAERLYARQGWQRCGEIPNYALLPDGPPCATTYFFKALIG